MKVIKNNLSVFIDVDETLVMHVIDGSESDEHIIIEGVRFLPHKRHIEQLKAHNARGHTVVVWSAGGYKWAETVIKILALEDYVELVMSKPTWAIDDQPSENWIKRYYYALDGTVIVGDEDERNSTKKEITHEHSEKDKDESEGS